jgi:hypothetical protein
MRRKTLISRLLVEEPLYMAPRPFATDDEPGWYWLCRRGCGTSWRAVGPPRPEKGPDCPNPDCPTHYSIRDWIKALFRRDRYWKTSTRDRAARDLVEYEERFASALWRSDRDQGLPEWGLERYKRDVAARFGHGVDTTE